MLGFHTLLKYRPALGGPAHDPCSPFFSSPLTFHPPFTVYKQIHTVFDSWIWITLPKMIFSSSIHLLMNFMISFISTTGSYNHSNMPRSKIAYLSINPPQKLPLLTEYLGDFLFC